MKLKLLTALAILLGLGPIASAHRLDELLQATLLTVEKDRIHASMRIIPGVAVSPAVLAEIDANRDGIFSKQEQQAYAERTLHALTLSLDGHPLHPKLLSATYPEIAQIKEGLGEIHIEFSADLPSGGLNRRLTFTNPPQTPNAVYLVNALVPRDPAIHIATQTRNEQQSVYQLDYTQTLPATTIDRAPWIVSAALFLYALACWLLKRKPLRQWTHADSFDRLDGWPHRPVGPRRNPQAGL